MKYRYRSVRGLEYCEAYSTKWYPVTGDMMMAMSYSELREIANVMEAALEDK